MLRALKASLNLENPFEACVWAMASCAYWGMMRFGEVSVQSRADFEGAKHLKRADVVFDRDLNGKRYARLDLPSAKTAIAGEVQSVFLVEQQGLCPLEALENLAKVVPAGPNDPLFSWMDGKGIVRPMVKDTALGKINSIIMACGWDNVWTLIQNWWGLILFSTGCQPRNC
jgi:hypothetical protein